MPAHQLLGDQPVAADGAIMPVERRRTERQHFIERPGIGRQLPSRLFLRGEKFVQIVDPMTEERHGALHRLQPEGKRQLQVSGPVVPARIDNLESGNARHGSLALKHPAPDLVARGQRRLQAGPRQLQPVGNRQRQQARGIIVERNDAGRIRKALPRFVYRLANEFARLAEQGIVGLDETPQIFEMEPLPLDLGQPFFFPTRYANHQDQALFAPAHDTPSKFRFAAIRNAVDRPRFTGHYILRSRPRAATSPLQDRKSFN